MHYVVDRIEVGIAICICASTGEEIKVKASDLPSRAKEGDVLAKNGEQYVYDENLTQQRRADLTKRMNRLFDKWKPTSPS